MDNVDSITIPNVDSIQMVTFSLDDIFGDTFLKEENLLSPTEQSSNCSTPLKEKNPDQVYFNL